MDKPEAKESYESAISDPLFNTLAYPFELCEAKNGWACEGCQCQKQCHRLFDRLTDLSSKLKLDATYARAIVMEFQKLKPH